ncbi:flagellar filament capping protein FliD [Alphaproteobacteria bacterium LSUCC0719]
MAIDYLSSLNVGSGLNTTEIIDALVEAERAPKASEINSAKEKRTVEISSLGQIKRGFETFDNGLAPIEEITGLSVTASGSSIDVKIADAKLAGSFSHAMNVTTVAAGQTLVFDGYSSETASTGTGTLSFSFGTWNSDGSFTANSDRSDVDVALATGQGTLADLRDAINASNMDVTASILKTGNSSYALVLKAREGAAHAMKVTATEDVGAAGLSGFEYTSPDSSIQTITASDAVFDMDGVTITRETNEVADLIKGVTLTIKSTTSTAETISGTYDSTLAESAMQIMVDKINSISTTLRDLSKRGAANEEDGPLAGDPYVRMLRRQLRNYTTTPVTGFGDSSIYLTDFGVTTNRDGSLSLDSNKFQEAFLANPDAFTAMTTSRITTGSELVAATVAGTYPKEGIYSFDIASDNTATLNGSAMTVSGSDYTISGHDAGGLKLTIKSSGADTNIYVGKSLFESLNNFSRNVLASGSDLQKKITNYNTDLSEYDEDLAALEESIERLRLRHEVKFAAMNAAVASLKETEKALDNMMEAWKGGMNQ